MKAKEDGKEGEEIKNWSRPEKNRKEVKLEDSIL